MEISYATWCFGLGGDRLTATPSLMNSGSWYDVETEIASPLGWPGWRSDRFSATLELVERYDGQQARGMGKEGAVIHEDVHIRERPLEEVLRQKVNGYRHAQIPYTHRRAECGICEV